MSKFTARDMGALANYMLDAGGGRNYQKNILVATALVSFAQQKLTEQPEGELSPAESLAEINAARGSLNLLPLEPIEGEEAPASVPPAAAPQEYTEEEAWLEWPHCAKCKRALHLEPGCEWPEDKSLALCGPCACGEVERLRALLASGDRPRSALQDAVEAVWQWHHENTTGSRLPQNILFKVMDARAIAGLPAARSTK